jgi:hypothetical protein
MHEGDPCRMRLLSANDVENEDATASASLAIVSLVFFLVIPRVVNFGDWVS